MKSLFENDIVKEIIGYYRLVWSINHSLSLLRWDMETHLPSKGFEERGIAVSELSVLRRRLLLDNKLEEMLYRAEAKESELNDYEKGIVRVLKREVDRLKKIPERIIAELNMTTVKANNAWREAREKSDYRIFKPYLKKIVELNREIAERIGYEEHPYDALLDLYEEGWKSREADRMFETIAPNLKNVLEKVISEGIYPSQHPLEQRKYEISNAEKINRRILEILGFPWDRARIDLSPHPFTTSMGINDVRITTRYEGVDIKRTVYSVIHEYGHALYELQIDERLSATPIANGVSMGVHESQSRFWENVVGRSKSFSNILAKLLKENLTGLEDLTGEEVYFYVNTVRPGYIRVEADELTYNFHIILRYKLEKMLIAGEISVDDVPGLWNDMMEEYLGIRPPNDRLGVLQDIHWSGGSIGYFPTYSLGTVLSAQIKYYLEKNLGKLDQLIAEGRYEGIKEWLREKIHRYGSTYPPKILIEKAFGEKVNPDYYNRYIVEKFLKNKGWGA